MNTNPQPFSAPAFHLRTLAEEFKKKLITERLDVFKWDLALTARSLGISRKNLWELRLKYGIEKPSAS